MDREEITRMAREAGMQLAWIATVPDTNKMKVLCDFDQVQHFAALVAAAEREACAKVCDAVQKKNEDDGAWMWEARNCAAAIRARGNK